MLPKSNKPSNLIRRNFVTNRRIYWIKDLIPLYNDREISTRIIP